MIRGIVWLLGCLLVGEVLSRLFGLPVPGAVVGMLLLVILLQVRRPAEDAHVLRAADGLLKHLQLLFIPASVGALAHLAVFADHPLPVLGGGLLSWALGLVTVALLGRALTRTPEAGE